VVVVVVVEEVKERLPCGCQMVRSSSASVDR